MTRRLFFITFFAFLVCTAVIALLLGKRSAQASETEVIERVAATYLTEADTGAKRTDCRAVPAQSDGLWLVVICTRGDGAGFEYFVNDLGRISYRRALEGGA